MGKLIDLSGQRFTRLLVLYRSKNTGNGKKKVTKWTCKCDCGKVLDVKYDCLKRGDSKSCGCLKRDKSTKHGLYLSHIYNLYVSAKRRAKKYNIKFDLTPLDIPSIPEYCPVLGIKLSKNTFDSKSFDSSPSLDRIIPEKGYTVGNIAIISYRANMIKSNGSWEEHMKIVDYIKKHEKMEVI